MHRVRRLVTVVALVGALVATAAPAQAAEEGCQIMGPHYVEGVVECVKTVIIPLIDWPDLPPHS